MSTDDAVSAAELDLAYDVAYGAHDSAARRWRAREKTLERLVHTRWTEHDPGEQEKVRSDAGCFDPQYAAHTKTVPEVCKALDQWARTSGQLLHEKVENDRTQWVAEQQPLAAQREASGAFGRQLTRILNWQKFAFVAESIRSHSGRGLHHLSNTVSRTNALLGALHEKLDAVVDSGARFTEYRAALAREAAQEAAQKVADATNAANDENESADDDDV